MIKQLASNKLYTQQYQEDWLVKSKERQTKYLIRKVGNILQNYSGDFLDIGCGIGTWAVAMKLRFGFSVTGIDINNQAIKESQKAGVKSIKTDIESSWPLPAKTFSVVTAIQVLEHVINPDHLLEEAHRVLLPDGILLITTPNLAAWFNRVIFLLGFQPFFLEVSTKDKTIGLGFTRKFTPERDPVGHIHVFTLLALKELLEINGFVVEKVLGGKIDYLPGFMQPFDRLFSIFPSLASDLIIIAKKRC